MSEIDDNRIARAIEATTISGASAAPDFDPGSPIPRCSRVRCDLWDGRRCYLIQAPPTDGVCEPVLVQLRSSTAPGGSR